MGGGAVNPDEPLHPESTMRKRTALRFTGDYLSTATSGRCELNVRRLRGVMVAWRME